MPYSNGKKNKRSSSYYAVFQSIFQIICKLSLEFNVFAFQAHKDTSDANHDPDYYPNYN